MIDPSTPREWQEAVDSARWALTLDAAVQYGLLQRRDGAGHVLPGSGVDVGRCEAILERGRALGYVPRRPRW